MRRGLTGAASPSSSPLSGGAWRCGMSRDRCSCVGCRFEGERLRATPQGYWSRSSKSPSLAPSTNARISALVKTSAGPSGWREFRTAT